MRMTSSSKPGVPYLLIKIKVQTQQEIDSAIGIFIKSYSATEYAIPIKLIRDAHES